MKKYLEGTAASLPLAGMIEEAGTAQKYNTGSWGTFKPIFLVEHCIQCFFCWVYCPDSAVLVEEGKVAGFDYEHCKGCAICEYECPTKPKSILMEKKEQ
jgi:pyruvate ferredoxin oxidoreductase delta subunit